MSSSGDPIVERTGSLVNTDPPTPSLAAETDDGGGLEGQILFSKIRVCDCTICDCWRFDEEVLTVVNGVTDPTADPSSKSRKVAQRLFLRYLMNHHNKYPKARNPKKPKEVETPIVALCSLLTICEHLDTL